LDIHGRHLGAAKPEKPHKNNHQLSYNIARNNAKKKPGTNLHLTCALPPAVVPLGKRQVKAGGHEPTNGMELPRAVSASAETSMARLALLADVAVLHSCFFFFWGGVIE